MPRGKKNSTTPSTTAKNASKSVAEPIKEKAAAPETKSVKPAVEKKKATAPKKAAAIKSSAKKALTSVAEKADSTKTVAVTETNKEAPKTTKKAATNTANKSIAAKTKISVDATAKKTAATDSKKRTVKKTANGKSDEVLFQSSGKDYTLSDITETCKNAYRGGTRKQIKSIKVYVKAEGNQLKAYYVVNDNISGLVDL